MKKCKIWMGCMTIIGAAECVTSDMLASAWQETEYCLDVCYATHGAHNEIYCACKRLCEVHWLEMYQFPQYTLWLQLYNVYFIPIWSWTLYILPRLMLVSYHNETSCNLFWHATTCYVCSCSSLCSKLVTWRTSLWILWRERIDLLSDPSQKKGMDQRLFLNGCWLCMIMLHLLYADFTSEVLQG